MNEDNFKSSLREKTLEHLFVGQLLRCLWANGQRDVEALRPEVNDAGYDVAIECSNVTRHIQLKFSFRGATTRQVKVNTRLAAKPSGCVIWLNFDRRDLSLGPFLWFGGKPGKRLPDIADLPVGKHTKANAKGTKAERPNTRVLRRSQFTELTSIEDVVNRLFGDGGR